MQVDDQTKPCPILQSSSSSASLASREPPHHDIMNESFHESRPSFQSLLSKLEHNKGSFNYKVTSSKSVRDLLQKTKSVRQLHQSINSLNNSKSNFFNNFNGSSKWSLNSIGALDSLREIEPHIIDDDDDDDDDEDEGDETDLEPPSALFFNSDSICGGSLAFVDDIDDEYESSSNTSTIVGEVAHQFNESLLSSDEINLNRRFVDHYTLGAELGSGAYAVVKEGCHRRTGYSYAVKIVEIEPMDPADLKALEIEIDVMASLSHPNIVRLLDAYREQDYYYLVMEKILGGELLDRVVQKTFYNEKEARDTCTVLFEAMKYCHSKGVAHRDLKPENLLLTSNECDSDIKIADFGFAKQCPPAGSGLGLMTMCGTPGYVAPEILERVPYDTQCDCWSLGVIVYILLGGYSPFEEKSQAELFRRIRAGDFEFHEEFWHSVSEDAKDLICSLLTVNPKKRLTATQALSHTWMTVSDDILASMDLGANLTELKRFNAKRKFKAAVKTIIATQKLTFLFLGTELTTQALMT